MTVNNNINIRHWKVDFFCNDRLLSSQGYCGTPDDVQTFAEDFLKNINGTNYQIQER